MNKILSLLALTLVLPLSTAFAQVTANVNANVNAEVKTNVRSDNSKSATGTAMSASSSASTTVQATSTVKRNDNASSTAKEKGQGVAESHRSAVAAFVQALLADADRDGGIGAEVRAVAESQQNAASTTAAAMTKLETRSGLKTFFIGTDWKSVGTLRSQIATTAADIKRLEAARDRTVDASIKADLDTQIEALKSTQTDLEEFAEDHEDTFSLFGWLTKMFQ